MMKELSPISERYPYAVSYMGNDPDLVRGACDALNLIHVTDYLYWTGTVRFRDESNATMYKLMQGT
jgi:hypothetical protein